MRRSEFCRLIAIAVAVGTTSPLAAQDGFLFDRPAWQVTLRGGYFLPSAGGEVFDFVTSHLTLGDEDFRTQSAEGEVTYYPTDRVGVSFGLGWSAASTKSEFRDWIGSDGRPIEQGTRLRIAPATLTVRYYLRPRGHTVGRLAWLPRETTPYVGGGMGMSWYRLRQHGEFVDFEDQSIFRSTLISSERALTTHLVVGVDHWFLPKAGLTVQGRYAWGSAATSAGGFSQMESVDVGGLLLSAGVALRW